MSATHAELRAATDDLRDRLAEATVAVDGVVRLEPTLRNALRRLQAGTTVLAGGQAARSAADGIELHRRVAVVDVVDVHVDLAVSPVRPASATARDVRAALTRVLRESGLEPGRLAVAVLSVER